MRERQVAVMVGCFMLLGIIALLVLALKVSGLSTQLLGPGYQVTANFDNVGDLKVRAPVTMAGVKIGQVVDIQLNKSSYKATVRLKINSAQNKIPDDSIANIYTQGLLGSNYISLQPGFADNYLKEGGQIQTTHSAIILENLIGQLMYSLQHPKK